MKLAILLSILVLQISFNESKLRCQSSMKKYYPKQSDGPSRGIFASRLEEISKCKYSCVLKLGFADLTYKHNYTIFQVYLFLVCNYKLSITKFCIRFNEESYKHPPTGYEKSIIGKTFSFLGLKFTHFL